MMFRLLMVFFLVFVANFCVDTGSSQKLKFVLSDESDPSETSSDESNDSTGDDSSDSNEDSDISKVISTPCAPVEKEYTFQELFGFEKMRSAYVDFRDWNMDYCRYWILYNLVCE